MHYLFPLTLTTALLMAVPAYAGDDATLAAITGHFGNPDGYVLDEGKAIAGFTYRDDDNTGSWEWIPSITTGIADGWEVGAWYVNSPESIEEGGVGAKYRLQSLKLGPEDASVAAYYTLRLHNGPDYHRLGIAASADFPVGWSLAGLREAEATAGVFYSTASESIEGERQGRGFDWFVGLKVPVTEHLTAVAEYEPEDGFVEGEAFSGGFRYDFGPWELHAGYESREDPFIGGEWKF